MKANVRVLSAQENDYSDLSKMVGELLNEIMARTNTPSFNFDELETEKRIQNLIANQKYWVFIAKETDSNKNLGFVSLYESYALYSQGEYGTIPELYVRSNNRSRAVGKILLQTAYDFSLSKGWNRLEVTTPSLPEFDRTLAFYQANGFEISGGKKLKIDIISN